MDNAPFNLTGSRGLNSHRGNVMGTNQVSTVGPRKCSLAFTFSPGRGLLTEAAAQKDRKHGRFWAS